MHTLNKTTKTITLATRESPLALWQAKYVKQLLEQRNPHIHINILGMTTQADQRLDVTLSKIGGKGLFIKELETALLNEEADIAVHSMKDVPMELPSGLIISAICPRANPFDAFVSNHYQTPEQLPQNAIVGTSSLRRGCQLKYWRSDIQLKFLRGNVQTRLRKLDDGEYDAIVLACAGLERLNLQTRITSIFTPNIMLPSTGQGAVGIECRSDDRQIKALLDTIHDPLTALCVNAERTFNNKLNGGCHAPVAAFAELSDQLLTLQGRVGAVDGTTLLHVEESIMINQQTDTIAINIMAERLAQQIINDGAQKLIQDALLQST